MIRHIVFFKFKEGVTSGEKVGLIDALKELKVKIPLVRELEVGSDVGFKHNSYDIALNVVFDNMEAVEEYAIHPDHVEVVEMVKKLCESSVKVDFEI